MLPADTRSALAICAEAVPLRDGGGGADGAADGAAVCVTVDVDAHTLAVATPHGWQDGFAACLDAVVTACADLIRCGGCMRCLVAAHAYRCCVRRLRAAHVHRATRRGPDCRGDLMEGASDDRIPLEVLRANARPMRDLSQETWQLATAANAPGSAFSDIHAEHVLGDSVGRFVLLRALSARMIRAEVAVWTSRLQLWSSQLGLNVELEPNAADVEGLFTSGMWIDERALEMMSASQLREVLVNAELTMLHDQLRVSGTS
jgi:hypothetical protein